MKLYYFKTAFMMEQTALLQQKTIQSKLTYPFTPVALEHESIESATI